MGGKVQLTLVLVFMLGLSGIGVFFYLGQEASIRDIRRQGDINSIALTMEVHYDDVTGKYTPLQIKQFSTGIPQDPISGAQCQSKPDSSSPLTMCHYCVGAYSNDCTVVAPGIPSGGSSWSVCAALEKGGTYCRYSSR